METNMQLVERVRPMSFSVTEFIGNKRAVFEMGKWFQFHYWPQAPCRLFSSGKTPASRGPGQMLLLSGPPGVGKSTALGIFCREYKLTHIEYNGSDDRNKDVIGDAVEGVCGVNATVQGNRAILVIEEADGLTPEAAAKIVKLGASSKRPIVCICNNPYALCIRGILRHPSVTHIKFHRIDWRHMVQRVVDVMQMLRGRTPTVSLVQDIAISSNGDMRRCIHLAQSASLKAVPHHPLSARKNAADKIYTVFEVTTMLLARGANLETRVRAAADEPRAAAMVRRNMVKPSGVTLDGLADATDKLSLFDMFDSNYELDPLYATYMTVAGGLAAIKGCKDSVFFSELPDDYEVYAKRAERDANIRAARSATRQGMRHSRAAMTMEVFPTLCGHNMLQSAVDNAQGRAAWFDKVASGYGLDIFCDETDDVYARAVRNSHKGYASAPGFVRPDAENDLAERHVYLAEVARGLSFGGQPINRRKRRSEISAAAVDEKRTKLDIPPDDDDLEPETPGGDSAQKIDAKKPGVPKGETQLRNYTLDASGAGPSKSVAIKTKKKPVRKPKFTGHDARRTHKLEALFSQSAPKKTLE